MSAQSLIFPLHLRHELSLRVDDHLTVPGVAVAFTGFADMPRAKAASHQNV